MCRAYWIGEASAVSAPPFGRARVVQRMTGGFAIYPRLAALYTWVSRLGSTTDIAFDLFVARWT